MIPIYIDYFIFDEHFCHWYGYNITVWFL